MKEANKIPEGKKVDHLILLVGGNPLPNAVAGRLLVREGATITLLHSQETAVIAQRLANWLEPYTQASIQFKQIDEASPNSIQKGIEAQLKKVSAKSVGLHYTGGTKAMAVHAYRAIEKWDHHQSPPVYSYLDANTLSLIIEGKDNPIPLARTLQLDLNDLLALHGWTLKNNPATTPIMPQFAQALLKLYSDDNLTAWNEWKEQELKKCRRSDRPDKWQSKTSLNKITLNWASAPELTDVVAALQEELEQEDKLQIKTATEAGRKWGLKKPEDLCKRLDGGYWLEDAVLEALQTIGCLHNLCTNVEPSIDDTGFELDVVAIRDYQLYGFSCGTDTDSVKGGRERLKLKLFEAYIRAKQLGGDEARVALVCSADDPEGLQAEVRRDLEAPHIRVFGRKQLLNLAEEFTRWMDEIRLIADTQII